VISVRPLGGGGGGGGAAEYYLRRDAGCDRDQPTVRSGYYLDGREARGYWLARGAEALKLSGPLDAAGDRIFRELMAGSFAGEPIAKPVLRYTDDGEPVDVRRQAYDVTLSAPKSVSVLMALGSPAVARQVREAHAAAVREAIGLLEPLVARAARGHQGDGQRAPRIGTDGLVAAAFEHSTSRALDPQLHTHVVLLNTVRGDDGRWSALDSRTLHRQATTASYLYQHRLRAELTERLGVAWTDLDKGLAEVECIPLTVRKVFSTRRRQIEQHLSTREAFGTSGRHAKTLAAKAASLITRPAKQHTPADALRAGWARKAAEAGFGPEQLATLLAEQHAPAPFDAPEVERHVLSGDGVTRERPTFDQGLVLRELIANLPPGTQLTTEQLLAWTHGLMTDDSVVQLVQQGLRSYTTVDMLEAERTVFDLAAQDTRTSTSGSPGFQHCDPRTVALLLRIPGLRPEQRDLAMTLLASSRYVDVIAGPAGSGKTSALRAAADVWRRDGRPVVGSAVAALTADALGAATGIPAYSVAALLNRVDPKVPHAGVVVVDEAGMLGTRQLRQLLRVAHERGSKVVLIGDPAQLPEIDAGGAFAALARLPHAIHLDGHHRQREPWERDTLHLLRNGQVRAALDTYKAQGRLHVHADRDEVLTHLAADYLQQRSGLSDPWQVVALAPRRSDVTDLNDRIREGLRREGLLGRRVLRVTLDDQAGGELLDYRASDQVLVTKNDKKLKVRNGTLATVRTVRRDGLVLQLRDGALVTVTKDWLRQGHLSYGFAMTLHKAQGRTVQTALVLGDTSLTQEAGYVGMSRGSDANHLYLDLGDESELRDHDCGQLRGQPSVLDIGGRVKALERSDRQHLARDLLDPAADRNRHDYPDRGEGLSR
jgi:conjugative relaxase-like TrwC/TraI family protein